MCGGRDSRGTLSSPSPEEATTPLPRLHFFFSGSSDRPEANYAAKDKLELLFSFPEC